MATTTTDDRAELIGMTPEAVGGDWAQLRSRVAMASIPNPRLGVEIGLAMNIWDVYVGKPITEEELKREIMHLGGG